MPLDAFAVLVIGTALLIAAQWFIIIFTQEVIAGMGLPVESSDRIATSVAPMCMARIVLPCDSRRMSIEDLGYSKNAQRTGHAPSRVRTMLKLLRGKLQQEPAASFDYQLRGGRSSAGRDLLPVIDEALGEWNKLDDLILQEKLQRRRIAARLTPFVSFFVVVHGQLLHINPKQRPKRTAAQKILMGAKVRETRRLRGTLGKRQKQKLKAQAKGPTVTITAPSPRGRR